MYLPHCGYNNNHYYYYYKQKRLQILGVDVEKHLLLSLVTMFTLHGGVTKQEIMMKECFEHRQMVDKHLMRRLI